MRLLLTHGFFLDEDEKEQQVLRPYPPLGILYLSSYLRSRGFDVDVYDSTFGSRDELFAILDDGPPAILGIYGNLLTRRAVLDITARARANGWRVILGGPEPSNYANEYLARGAEYIVAGEGERVLERILQGDRAPDGVFFRAESGAVGRTAPAEQAPSLDALPWPDRERIDIRKYLAAWRQRHGMGSLSLITARGCPYSCRWCSHSVYGQTHRRRSVADVADEVEWLIKRYSPEMLWYADDVFTIHPGWTLRYAAELKRRSLKIPFECITRADRVSEPLADALAQMGCFRVWVGSESGSQRILDAMARGVHVEQVHRAVEMLQSRGIAAGMFLMWGYEGEGIEDIEATVAHVQKSRPDVFLTTISYPLKGTPYFDEVKDRLAPVSDWATSTDRDFRIRGRHSRRFYGFADDLLKASMQSTIDPARIAAARAGLRESVHEVEA